MALTALHSVGDNVYSALDVTISDVATSCVARTTAFDAVTVPFLFDIGSEIVECTVVTTSTPTSGKSTLTIARAKGGTIAAAHTAGDVMAIRVYSELLAEMQRAIANMQRAIMATVDNADGVIATTPATDLKVVQQASPNMTAKVSAGAAIVALNPVALSADATSATIVAPVSNPRIDIVQISKAGVVSVKAGAEAGSPSAPAVDADCLKLAEILLATSSATITTGMITDSRVFV